MRDVENIVQVISELVTSVDKLTEQVKYLVMQDDNRNMRSLPPVKYNDKHEGQA